MRRRYERNFLMIECLVSVAITVLLVIGINRIYGEAAVMGALKGSRQALYTALASTGGSLLGFILTSVSVVMIFGQMPRFNLLRDKGRYNEAFGVYFQAIQWLAIATIWSILALLIDTDTAPKPV